MVSKDDSLKSFFQASNPNFSQDTRLSFNGAHLSAVVGLRVVDVQLERPPLVSLDQREEVLGLVQHRVGADDVVGVGPQTRALRRTGRQDLQNVPDVLVGALEGAEPDGDAQKALTAPQRARCNKYFANL